MGTRTTPLVCVYIAVTILVGGRTEREEWKERRREMEEGRDGEERMKKKWEKRVGGKGGREEEKRVERRGPCVALGLITDRLYVGFALCV